MARYAAFRQATPTYRIRFSPIGADSIQGTAIVDRSDRARYIMKGPDLDYVGVATRNGSVELDYTSHTSDEHGYFGTIALSHSRLTTAVQLFPFWTAAPSLQRIIPASARWNGAGRETVDGRPCEHLHTQFKTQMGEATIDAWIDDTGRPRRFSQVSRVEGMVERSGWRILEWEPARNLTAQTFTLPIPNGFVPFALPSTDGPLETGNAFPLSGWSGVDLRRKLSPKGLLVAVLGTDSAPSAQALASLGRLRSTLPVVTLGDSANTGLKVDGFDATGAAVRKLRVTATPLFVRLDGRGVIQTLWMGYDSEKAAKFEADVRSAFNGGAE